MAEITAASRSPHFGQDAAVQAYIRIHLPRVFVPWADVLLEVVPPRSGDAVLDVATGPGTVARHAAGQVGAVLPSAAVSLRQSLWWATGAG